MVIFFTLFLKLNSLLFAGDEVHGVSISYHASEFSITNQKAAKALFLRIPGKRVDADLVSGLVFKYGEYLFCVREPERIYHCHIYLNNKGEGKLSSHWQDHDYGKGSFFEFVEKQKQKGKASVSVKNGVLAIYFEGEMATTFFERMDLAETNYLRDGNLKYEKRKGEHMNCIAIEGNKKDYHACRLYLPLEENKGDEPKIKDLI